MKHKPNLLICLISAALFMTAFISGTSYINAQETQDTKTNHTGSGKIPPLPLKSLK